MVWWDRFRRSRAERTPDLTDPWMVDLAANDTACEQNKTTVLLELALGDGCRLLVEAIAVIGQPLLVRHLLLEDEFVVEHVDMGWLAHRAFFAAFMTRPVGELTAEEYFGVARHYSALSPRPAAAWEPPGPHH